MFYSYKPQGIEGLSELPCGVRIISTVHLTVYILQIHSIPFRLPSDPSQVLFAALFEVKLFNIPTLLKI